MTIHHSLTREFCERLTVTMHNAAKPVPSTRAKRKRKKAVPADEWQPRPTIPLLLDREMLITPANPLPLLVLGAQVGG